LAAVTAGGRPVTPALFATIAVDDDAERAEAALDAYCRATYAMGREDVGRIQALFAGDAASVIRGISAYAAAGASHVLLRLAAVEPAAVATQFERAAGLLEALRAATR
jgi:hypothetical protein